MPIPRAQELNELITLQTATGGKNVRGGRMTLVTYTTAWARITETSGYLEVETQTVQAGVKSFEVWIRYNDATALTGNHQIKWGSRVLTQSGPPIKVIDGANRQWWQISAEERTEHD